MAGRWWWCAGGWRVWASWPSRRRLVRRPGGWVPAGRVGRSCAGAASVGRGRVVAPARWGRLAGAGDGGHCSRSSNRAVSAQALYIVDTAARARSAGVPSALGRIASVELQHNMHAASPHPSSSTRALERQPQVVHALCGEGGSRRASLSVSTVCCCSNRGGTRRRKAPAMAVAHVRSAGWLLLDRRHRCSRAPVPATGRLHHTYSTHCISYATSRTPSS
jgi:hypothetical protein